MIFLAKSVKPFINQTAKVSS